MDFRPLVVITVCSRSTCAVADSTCMAAPQIMGYKPWLPQHAGMDLLSAWQKQCFLCRDKLQAADCQRSLQQQGLHPGWKQAAQSI